MKKWLLFISLIISYLGAQCEEMACVALERPEGLSFDIGGTYTWMSFSTPPTYSGSAGGALAKITYVSPDHFFAQARSFYNGGSLSSSANDTDFQESYSEFVAGYRFCAGRNVTVTPYVGWGFDFLFDDHAGYSTISPIHLNYTIYYAVIGLETHCFWPRWGLGLRLDCLPTFNQYLRVKSLSGAAWTLQNRTGADVQLPLSYRCFRKYWLELTPYYRFFPLGSSDSLGLPSRNLNQWGAFVIFRFCLC